MLILEPEYNAIYLSPHLDDAALSCGGHIYAQTQAGERVLIVTVTAGDAPLEELSPFAQQLHADWGLSGNPVAGRRAEDIEACRILGADYAHWEIRDCIYRRHPLTGEPLYPEAAALFGAVHSAEFPHSHSLAQRFAALPAARAIYGPLGVGRHVDHQLVRISAEMCFGARLQYYEDYPYVGEPGRLDAALGASADWSAALINLSPAAVAARIAAIAAYTSQIAVLFGSTACLPRCVRNYVAGVGGERIWRAQPSPKQPGAE